MTQCLTFHFRQQVYQFHFKIGFFLLCLFFFSVTCILGFWQLHRYDYKKQLLIQHQHNSLAVIKPFSKIINQKDLQFQPVRVQGHYVNDLMILIQNRFHDNKPGFEVLTPIRMAGEKKLLLVDRGWIEKKKDQVFPDHNILEIKNHDDAQQIIGTVKLLDEKQFILGKNILTQDKKNNILIVQKIDFYDISQATQEEFFPYILRLDPQQSDGFLRDWTVTYIIPERHLAYAIQWFLLACVVSISFVCFCCEKANEK